MKQGRFQNFAAIDWSGAVGKRHRGIAVALCGEGERAPQLIRPGHIWSREEVADWLLEELPHDTLVGIDLSMGFPFADRAAYLPGWDQSPSTARELWQLVEQISANDPHLAVSSFVDHRQVSPHFRRHGGREGAQFGGGRGRFRVTERAKASQGTRPYSNFNLVGAAQVGKSSLTGMRLLHRVSPPLAVWPFDPLPTSGSVLVEIYTTIAAIEAGRPASRSKMRSYAELNQALSALGCAPLPGSGPIDDHSSDALLTAAWLRIAAHRQELWNPDGLNEIAQTEGWTFGAVSGKGLPTSGPA